MRKYIIAVLFAGAILFAAACHTGDVNKMVNGKKILISENKTYLAPEILSVGAAEAAACETSSIRFDTEEQFVDRLKNLNFTASEEAVVYNWSKNEKGIILPPLDYYYKLKSVPTGYGLESISWGEGSVYGYNLTNQKGGMYCCVYEAYDAKNIKKIATDFGATLTNVKEFWGADDVTVKIEKRGSNDISIFGFESPDGAMRIETWQYDKEETHYTIVNFYGSEAMYAFRSHEYVYDRSNPVASRILIETGNQCFLIIAEDANHPIDNQFAEQFQFIRKNL